jgi:uncharacterized protein YbgA (DUF1722 family)/uncharacterized protein YbbK (DUF523 family)
VPHVDFITVCPEVEIGLGIPRKPLRIVTEAGVRRLIQPATGADLTDRMSEFAKSFLSTLPEIDGFVLKSRSPTSGIKDAKVYEMGKGGVTSRRGGPGFFGRSILDAFSHLPIEDEGRLRNSRIKDHFLTAVFTLAWFRSVKASGSADELAQFHSRNELLFNAHNKEVAAGLERLVSEYSRNRAPSTMEGYELNLYNLLRKAPTCSRNADTIGGAFDHLSGRMSQSEKDYFLQQLSAYSAGTLPVSVPIGILQSHILRFEDSYLENQSFFEPYPRELADIDTATAHCDGREYWN